MDIKELRTKLNLTPAELADKLGVHIRTVARWEKHETEPSPMARRAIEILGINNELKHSEKIKVEIEGLVEGDVGTNNSRKIELELERICLKYGLQIQIHYDYY